MSTPAGDNAFLYELEVNVRTELTLAGTGQPEVDAHGALTIESLLERRMTSATKSASAPFSARSRRWKTAPRRRRSASGRPR